MNILILQRDTVIRQTIQNMIEAQVIRPEEEDMLTEQLQQLDSRELIIVLVESHQFREQAQERIRWYPIGELYSN